jgi:hypothetical protein
MSGEHHRGIRYSITAPVPGKWRWAIHPPDSVKGFQAASGELAGSREDAVAMAKRQIETQELRTFSS